MMARYVVSLLVCWLACDGALGQVCFNPPCGPSATPTPSRQPGAPSGGCGSGLTCQTYVACAVHVVDSTGLQTCSLGTGNSGMCCPPAELDPPTESRPTEIGGDDLIQNRIRETEIRTFNQNELNTAASEAELTLRTLQEKDRETLQSGNTIKPGAPGSPHQRFHRPTSTAVDESLLALRSIEASRSLQKEFDLSTRQAGLGLSKFEAAGQLTVVCPKRPQCVTPRRGGFRTIDGSCNNPLDTIFGRSNTQAQRILPAAYDDGIFAPRTRSSAGRTLPSARAVSAEVFKSDERVAEDQKTTAGFVQWGQFVDHDLTLGAIFTLDAEGTGHQCCTEDGRAIRNAEFPCFPIEIATDDPFYSPFRQRCMNFVRGRPAPRLDCKLGYAEQINQLTAWLDASMVYGSDDTEAAALRAFRGGQMRIQGRGQKSLLPLNPREDEVFRAGDGRVNEWIGLTAMHTIFVREHNRLAAELEQLNRDWDDERIYQETRKIVGAIVQHITYNEFLPLSLGYRYLRNFGLLPLRSGFKRNYDPKIKPQITNEFATAAFRYGHTKMPGTWKLFFSESGRPREIQVSPFLENPQIIFQNQAVDALMRAFSRVPAAGTDGAFTTELRGLLFKEEGRRFGMDLMALNIQRGRDHGLASYNDYREICALGRLRDWTAFERVFGRELTSRFQRVYESVDDIDLFAGGSVEPLVPGTELGPTFLCINGDMFARLQKGDRFYYELGGEPHSFSPEQLDQIRRVSLARVLCDNSEALRVIQPLVMARISTDNPLVRCDDEISIPRMDLTAWRSRPFRG